MSGGLETFHADLALARRLEDTETTVSTGCLTALLERYPESGATAAPLAGGMGLFFGSTSPLSQALGIGMQGPVSAEDFDRLEAFFRARTTPVVISYCPLADASVLRHIFDRRYRITHFENTLVRRLGAEDGEDQVGVAREIADGEGAAWSRMVIMGFADGEPPPGDDLLRLFTAFLDARRATAWAVCSPEGELASGGIVSVLGKTAMFYGDATLPQHRGRGYQSAIIAARVRQAARAGCDLAVACTAPGSTSQKNYERAGFRVVYTKMMFVWDGGS